MTDISITGNTSAFKYIKFDYDTLINTHVLPKLSDFGITAFNFSDFKTLENADNIDNLDNTLKTKLTNNLDRLNYKK